MYVGLATDTGFFRFNSTTARAHRIAAELMRIGVEPARTYQAIYERNSEAFTRLLGHALVGLRLDAGGAIASVTLTRKLLAELNAEDVDTSEITTTLLAMDGVVLATLFRELDDDRVKVSLRSKGDLDVHLLATQFGGGGHRNASGIVLPGPMEDVVRTITGRAATLLAPSSAD
jgi:phosphoesterase RecJ-like protein